MILTIIANRTTNRLAENIIPNAPYNPANYDWQPDGTEIFECYIEDTDRLTDPLIEAMLLWEDNDYHKYELVKYFTSLTVSLDVVTTDIQGAYDFFTSKHY